MKIRNEIQHKMLVDRVIEQNYFLLSTFYYLKKSYYLTILILLSITIGSCYSIESDCDDSGDFYWERTSGQPSNIHLITVASNGDIWSVSYYDGALLATVYLSTNNGNTWVEKNNSFINGMVTSIGVSPKNGYIFVASDRQGLLRSTDRGETWVRVANRIVYDIIFTPTGEIYFATQFKNVFHSSDNGDTWIEKNNRLLSWQNITSLAIGLDGTLYEGTTGGVYRSTDGGNNWLPTTSYTTAILPINDITVSDDGSVFVATQNFGVLKSTNRGSTWTEANNGLANQYVIRIIFNPITKDIFVSGHSYSSNVYRSTSAGKNWELKNRGLPEPNTTFIWDFALNPNTGQMYAATGDGVYRSRGR